MSLENVKLYNSLSRKKEDFMPLKEGHVTMYSCGPTVYNFVHIGNLRAFILSDLLRRSFILAGFKVTQVMNLTDVGHLTDDADNGEDKMEKGARREGKTAWDIAKFYTDAFLSDINELNILTPDILCKATDNISEQIDMVKVIEDRGFSYRTLDGIYFDTSKLDEYGELIKNFDASSLDEGRRVSSQGKKNPADFALWKFSPTDKSRTMEWDSPWGVGFPGWHIECTAMSMKYLGDKFDIHTGGVDHIPVHHTNELAQARACTGDVHARFWLHNEFLVLDKGKKMAKSEGNFLRLDSLVKEGFEALDYRYFLLGTHYRKQVMFSFEGLRAARSARKSLIRKVSKLKKGRSFVHEKKFKDALFDDLNTSVALSVLNDMVSSEINSYDSVAVMDDVLGLSLSSEFSEDIPVAVLELAKKRLDARKNRNYKLADSYRDKILEKGYLVRDVNNEQGFELESV